MKNKVKKVKQQQQTNNNNNTKNLQKHGIFIYLLTKLNAFDIQMNENNLFVTKFTHFNNKSIIALAYILLLTTQNLNITLKVNMFDIIKA